MMNAQDEMLSVLQCADEQAAARRMAALHEANERWENWGRIGQLTREQIHPDWSWGDYSI